MMRLILSCIFILGFYGCQSQKTDPADTFFQVNSFAVFAKGNYDGYFSYEEIKKLGDFGIGTFNRLNGEMIMLDGEVFRIEPDGLPVDPPENASAPLATFCHFDADLRFELESMDFPELKHYIDERLPDLDLFYAIRISGEFENIITRSIDAQEKPYLPVFEVLKQEVRRTTDQSSGTIVGFKSPVYLEETLWYDYHLHYISDDKTIGGHLHEASIVKAVVEIDVMSDFKLFMNPEK